MKTDFTKFTGLVAALPRDNVDTDQIIPKQFLKSIKRTGFGVNLFDSWRYLDPYTNPQEQDSRRLNPDFELNQARFSGATILLALDNFGCGSSREHAPWALKEYGFQVIIAPSFADIFFNNCFQNSILPISLERDLVDFLLAEVAEQQGYSLTIRLDTQTIETPGAKLINFPIDLARKERLLKGLDDIGMSLELADKIRAYEQQAQKLTPWNFS